MIVGVGIDVVDLDRFATALQRTPRMAQRLFTERELYRTDGTPLSPRSLAGRFAVKEAVAKALGVPAGMAWHDCEVLVNEAGQPRVELAWTVAAAADAIRATAWHVSISHDSGIVVAYVAAECTDR